MRRRRKHNICSCSRRTYGERTSTVTVGTIVQMRPTKRKQTNRKPNTRCRSLRKSHVKLWIYDFVLLFVWGKTPCFFPSNFSWWIATKKKSSVELQWNYFKMPFNGYLLLARSLSLSPSPPASLGSNKHEERAHGELRRHVLYDEIRARNKLGWLSMASRRIERKDKRQRAIGRYTQTIGSDDDDCPMKSNLPEKQFAVTVKAFSQKSFPIKKTFILWMNEWVKLRISN